MSFAETPLLVRLRVNRAEVRKRGSLGFVVETSCYLFSMLSLDLSVNGSVQCGRVFDTGIRW